MSFLTSKQTFWGKFHPVCFRRKAGAKPKFVWLWFQKGSTSRDIQVGYGYCIWISFTYKQYRGHGKHKHYGHIQLVYEDRRDYNL